MVYLRSSRNDLNIFTLDWDYGICIITKNKPDLKLDYSLKEIKILSYKELDQNREYLLNLKKPEYLNEFIKHL